MLSRFHLTPFVGLLNRAKLRPHVGLLQHLPRFRTDLAEPNGVAGIHFESVYAAFAAYSLQCFVVTNDIINLISST